MSEVIRSEESGVVAQTKPQGYAIWKAGVLSRIQNVVAGGFGVRSLKRKQSEEWEMTGWRT